MPEHPKGGRRHPRALTFRGLLMWGGDPHVHGFIVPVLLSDHSRGRHVGAPHNCLQSLHKARAESALQGRNTRWQGHSKIPGATWLVGWGFHCL